MTDIREDRPWEQLEHTADEGSAERLGAFVDALGANETARALAHLDTEGRNHVLEALPADEAADLVADLPRAQAADLLEALPPDVAAEIIGELRSEQQADLLTELDKDDAEEILAELAPDEANEIRALAAYPEDSAGGLMATEFVALRSDMTIRDVAEHFRTRAEAYSDYDIQYAYVMDGDDHLVGVLRMRDLLFTPGDRQVDRIMIADPFTVRADSTLDDIDTIFRRRKFLALPVVDDAGRMLGIVHRLAVEESLGDRANADHLKALGIVGGEELRTMPLILRSRRRLAWLSVNIVLNVLAASVIAMYEETLTAVIALAVFLPIISDMSGCSGNQAVAVSIRELTLGLVKPHELFYVWLKEAGIGVLNGLILGTLIGAVAFMWKGNVYLGVVVGTALMLNTLVAVSIGGTIPLVLKRLGMDPALAAGPVLTTITDICGFFFVLAFATLALSKLVTL
jgi:magnesium transporter